MSETFSAVDDQTGEVIEFRGGQLALPGRASSVGLDLPESLTFEEWQGVGHALQSVNRSVMWWIGDWLRYGESRWGEMYEAAVEETGRTYGSLAIAKHVAERFEFLRRRKNLSWSHHQETASLPTDEADEVLSAAEAGGWSTRETRAEVHRRKTAARIEAPANSDGCTVDDLQKLLALGQRFGTVYADPPWRYGNVATRASVDDHYDGTMSIEEIAALPVGDLAADDAHLHLWTTNGFIFETAKLFDAWGFTFKSAFVWVKPQMGIGNYWRNSHEYLLTAIRGNAKHFSDHSLKSWAAFDRGEHSAKPEQVRTMIERASPGPYLELFGRRTSDRWTVWGNQIPTDCLFAAATRKVA